MRTFLCRSAFLLLAMPASAVAADAPEATTRDDNLVATMHAQGAQIYECQTSVSGALAWQFREPIASLIVDGKTIGRHYAGPSWEMADGSRVTGKVEARAPGATNADIPLLWLAVTSRHGDGKLAEVTLIRRINTRGGTLDGACDQAGVLRAVPYSADYTFHTKTD
jgi:hypothetical protein